MERNCETVCPANLPPRAAGGKAEGVSLGGSGPGLWVLCVWLRQGRWAGRSVETQRSEWKSAGFGGKAIEKKTEMETYWPGGERARAQRWSARQKTDLSQIRRAGAQKSPQIPPGARSLAASISLGRIMSAAISNIPHKRRLSSGRAHIPGVKEKAPGFLRGPQYSPWLAAAYSERQLPHSIYTTRREFPAAGP